MSEEFEDLKIAKVHNKKNQYVVDRHANLEKKAKKAFKRRQFETEDDDWQEEIRFHTSR